METTYQSGGASGHTEGDADVNSGVIYPVVEEGYGKFN